MKSSITVTPGPSWPGARATLPLVNLTRLTSSDPKSTPRNEKVWSPGNEGTKNVPRDSLLGPKNINDVVSGRATWVKTAPKPRVSAGTELPGTKKFTSTMFELIAVNSFGELNT